MSAVAALIACLVVAVGGSAFARPLHAQTEGPERAVVFGGPSTLGLIVPISARWALRPDLSYARTTFKVAGTTSNISVIGLGAGALITLHERDALRDYLAPRVGISRTIYNDGSHADTWIFDALYGAHWKLGARVGVFGEGGARFTNVRPASSPGSNSSSAGLSLRSNLGLTLGF